jgi:hypothetical protein
VLHSPNILTAATPEEIQWTTLPDDEGGIRQYNDTTNVEQCGNGTGACLTPIYAMFNAGSRHFNAISTPIYPC